MLKDNPLRILTNDQLNNLDLTQLKSIKKEILLRFQLTPSPLIVVNGIEIDKNGVLEVFELLENGLSKYLFIHNNKILDDFLNGKSDLLLTDQEALSRILRNEENKTIESKIVARLQELALEYFKNDRNQRIFNLTKLQSFVKNFNPNLEDQIFSKLYERIKKHIEKLNDLFEDELTNPSSYNLPDGIHKYVNYSFFAVLDCLPTSFDGLLTEYCAWCNSIVYNALTKNNRYDKHTRKDLNKIKEAATIAAEQFNQDVNLKIAKEIQSFLKIETKVKSIWSPIFSVLFVLFMIIKLFAFISNIESSTSTYNRQHSKSTYPNNKELKNIEKLIRNNRSNNSEKEIYNSLKNSKEAQKKAINLVSNALKRDEENRNKRGSKYYSLDYAGENIKSTNSKLIKEKHFKSFSELTYHIDVFPTYSSNLNLLVPKSLKEKYNGQIRPIVLQFKNPQIKGHLFSHKILADFEGRNKIPKQEYKFKTPKESEDLYLSMKTISKKNYPLQGLFSRLNSEGKVLHSTKFTIEYSKQDGYQVTLLSSGDKYMIPREYINNLVGNTSMQERDRFAIALKNLSLVHNKHLKQGNIFSIKNTLGYTIENSTNKEYPLDELISESCTLKNYITSSEDNTSYVRLSGRKINIKYLADNKTGRIQGMTMISASSDLSEIERLQIFSSK